MIRKSNSLLALSALGIIVSSINAYATPPKTYSTNNLNLVRIPSSPNQGFEFNAAAVWLRPGASNLNYVIYNKELPAQSPSWTERELRPSFTAGFELGARYIFGNCQGQDVRLNWTHLRTDDSAYTVAPSSSFFLGPDYEIGPAGLTSRDAYGDVKFKYDIVNLDVGQLVQVGERLQLRLFGGLSGGYLEEDLSSTYSGTVITGDFPGPFSMNQYSKSKFNGVGPRFGVSAYYDAGCGFGFNGETAMSALIGSMDSKTNFTGSSAELLGVYGQTINSQFIKDQRVYQVIPGFDFKLGIDYQYMYANTALFKVSAGYQASVYVNAISQYLPGSLVVPFSTGGIFVATMAHRLSNYSVQGPYLNFAIQI